MPKIIFTSHYMRDAPAEHLKNYVEYIGTREGVEKIDESKALLPATIKQRKLIGQLVRDIPESREMLEYSDYQLHPTIGNASELITRALEQNLDFVGKRENYVDYIANRPRVERVGEHGLFTDAGVPVVLSQVQNDVVSHKGPVWTHVVSLRREDAARLGYDSGKEWMALLRSKRAMFSKHMKIDSENLRWYAAFHNESHHPHVHIMVYSAKDNDGYLTKESIEAMRSELAHDIFRQDFAHIYEEQNQARAGLKQGAADLMDELLRQIASGVCEDKVIEEKIQRLAGRLQNTGGKKVYGYLKADVKALVDQIVDELAQDARVAELYAAWSKWQDEILKTYTGKLQPLPPLSRQPQFKSIKNMVIAEAMKIGGRHFTFEDEAARELPEQDATPEPTAPEDFPEPYEPGADFRADWSKEYKLARKYLYGGKNVEQDFTEAYRLFLSEAESGNGLAMHASAGCARMAWAWNLTRRPLKSGTPRPSPPSSPWSRPPSNGSKPICSTASASCTRRASARRKTMNRPPLGSHEPWPPITSTRNTPSPRFIIAGMAWHRIMKEPLISMGAAPDRKIPTPATNWPRCAGTGSAPKRIWKKPVCILQMRSPAFISWSSKATTISSNTASARCSTPEPAPKRMTPPR